MKKTKLAKMPEKRAQDYELEGKKFARVMYVPKESKADRVEIEVQAFEVDSKGNFVAVKEGLFSGAPSRTSGSVHVIATSGIGDTHTLQPGWVRVVGTYTPADLDPTVKTVKALPKTAEVGEQVYMGDTLYRWDEGILETVMRGKAEELERLLKNAPSIAAIQL